jgi:hypothetical protein
MRQRLRSHLRHANVVAATCLAGLALAAPAAGSGSASGVPSASSFRVGLPPHSYVTFQVGDHPPEHQDYGYFVRGWWPVVKDCGLYATHKGKRVQVRVGNHRITNPHPFSVWVQCP